MDEPKEILVEIGGKLVKLTLRYDTYLAVYWGKHMGELVRCKDCKYHTAYNECTNEHWDSKYSPDYPVVDDKDYCSRAERKTDNG